MSAMPERRPREPRGSDADDERLRQFLQWREETGRARHPRPRSSFPFFGVGFVLTLIAIGVAWWTWTSEVRRPHAAVQAPAPVSEPAAPDPPASAAASEPEPAASPVTPESTAQPVIVEPVVPQSPAPPTEIAPSAPAARPAEDAAPELPPRKGKRFAVDRVPVGRHPAPLTPLATPSTTREEATEPAGASPAAERTEPATTIDLPPRRVPGR